MTDPPAVAPQRVWKARTDPATPHDVGHARPMKVPVLAGLLGATRSLAFPGALLGNLMQFHRRFRRIPAIGAIAVLCALVASDAFAERIVAARYADPVDRYGHFALGRPHEYARVTATTDAGRQPTFDLPDDEVFEDLAPRVVSLAAGETQEILAIVSRRGSGARLVMLRLRGDRLEISAQSAPIGTPMRWLNPVGVADLDGDGHAEIAAVITPHIGGTLKVYRREGAELVEVAALGGFSNHVYGSAELALSAPMSIAGTMRLLVPDTTRRQLRIVGLDNGRLVETGRCLLAAPVSGAIRVISATEISIGLASGRTVIAPQGCQG